MGSIPSSTASQFLADSSGWPSQSTPRALRRNTHAGTAFSEQCIGQLRSSANVSNNDDVLRLGFNRRDYSRTGGFCLNVPDSALWLSQYARVPNLSFLWDAPEVRDTLVEEHRTQIKRRVATRAFFNGGHSVCGPFSAYSWLLDTGYSRECA